MAQCENCFEVALAKEHLAGSGVEDRLFVDEGQIVVDRSGALRPHREAAGEQFRDQDMVGEVLTRVHECDHDGRPGTVRRTPVTLAPSAVASSWTDVVVSDGCSAASM